MPKTILSDMRTGVRSNVGWSVLSKGLGIGVKLAAVVVLTRVLGASDFGIIVWVLSVTALLVVFADLGASASVARYIAEEPGNASLLLKRGACIVTGSTLLLSTGLGLLAEPLGKALETVWLVDLRWIVAGVLGVQVWLRFLGKAYEGLAQQRVQGRVQVWGGWWPWGLCILAVVLGWGVEGALLGYVVGSGLLAVWLSIALWRILPDQDETSTSPPTLQAVLTYSAPLIATAASFYIFTSSDILILQAYLGSDDVGVYGAAVRLLDSAHLLSGAVGSGLAVHFVGEIRRNKGREFFRLTTQAMLSVYLPIAVGVGVLAPQVVLLVFGTGYESASFILQLYLPYFVLKSVTPTYSLTLDYMGDARRRAFVVGAAAAANVILNLWLIPIWGAVGAAIATQVTYLPVGAWYAWRLNSLCSGSMARAGSDLVPTLTASVMMAAALLLVKVWTSSLWVLIVVGFVVYSSALCGLGGFKPVYEVLLRRRQSQSGAELVS